jgi:hypothetical protein
MVMVMVMLLLLLMLMSSFASNLHPEQVLRAPAAAADADGDDDDGDDDDAEDLASSSQALGCYCFCPIFCHEYVVESQSWAVDAQALHQPMHICLQLCSCGSLLPPRLSSTSPTLRHCHHHRRATLY